MNILLWLLFFSAAGILAVVLFGNRKEDKATALDAGLIDVRTLVTVAPDEDGKLRLDETLSHRGPLIVPDGVTVIGDIDTVRLQIDGSVEGTARALERITISASGSNVGVLHAPRILLDEHCRSESQLNMARPDLDFDGA